jgi:hypothetical protein
VSGVERSNRLSVDLVRSRVFDIPALVQGTACVCYIAIVDTTYMFTLLHLQALTRQTNIPPPPSS